MRRPRVWLSGALLAILVAMAAGGWLGRRLTYLPPVRTARSSAPAGWEAVAIDLPGGMVAGWHAPGGDPARAALLYLYGNGGDLLSAHAAGILDRLRGEGRALLAIDYPGYGASAGSPSEGSVAAAADAALAWLRSREPSRRAVLVGQSLGGGAAAGLAARHPEQVSGLVLLSPFTSLPDAAAAHYPRWLVWLLLRERYPVEKPVRAFPGPVLVVHGTRDAVIPVSQGRAVASAAGPRGRMVEVAGADHNDLADFPETWEAVRSFLADLERPGR